MGNYFISLLDMVIVIGAPSPPLTIVIPNGHRIQFVVCARFRKKGSDLGYEDMIKYAIKELKTNHGGIVTASERFQPVRPLCYILPLSRKKSKLRMTPYSVSHLDGIERDTALGSVWEV